jgi:hypothetical protein
MAVAGIQAVRIADVNSKAAVRAFVELPYHVYRSDSQWVPPLRRDVAVGLDRARHPFYEHSDAAFFTAHRGVEIVGRLAVLEHRPYNECHGVRQAGFSFFECRPHDEEAATALFERAFDWGRARGLTEIVGPKGLTAFDGFGLLVDGFDRRQLMTMSNYNPAWYPEVLERLGFEKEVDFVSYELTRETFVMPEAVRRAARRATDRLDIVRYANRRALIREAGAIGRTYNKSFVNNWEYYPVSDREIDFLVEQISPLADHRLMTFIAANGDIVGFVLAFADVSRALQRMRGRLTPWGLVTFLAERHRTKRVALNGAGILPDFRGQGGNALLYLQIERAVRAARFDHAELPQVAESALRMRRDIEVLGGVPIKTHRVYRRPL